MSDYSKLLETLRYCQVHPFRPCDGCGLFDTSDCINTLHTDAAAAIEELQAEVKELKRVNIEIFEDLPKRGEWVYNDGDYIPYCSICGMPQDTETPYCHFCGAKMEVQE